MRTSTWPVAGVSVPISASCKTSGPPNCRTRIAFMAGHFLPGRARAGCLRNDARLHGDFGLEQTRDRAAFLGFSGGCFECRLIGISNFGGYVELHLGDGPAGVELLQSNRCRSFQAFWRDVYVAKLCCQCHGETARVRGGNQLFWIGAFFVFETSGERVGSIRKHAAIRGNLSFAFLERAVPNGRSLANHV